MAWAAAVASEVIVAAAVAWDQISVGRKNGRILMERSGPANMCQGPRYDREAIPFPTKPPYTAHLGNLDYNVTSVDLEGFLADCNVTVVRLMEDKVDRKPKGFGYAEFGSPEGLQKALDRSESNFMGRNIKISVADPRTSMIFCLCAYFANLL